MCWPLFRCRCPTWTTNRTAGTDPPDRFLPLIIGEVMQQPISTIPPDPNEEFAADRPWTLLLAASRLSERLAAADELKDFAFDPDGPLRSVPPAHAEAIIRWRPGIGWEGQLPSSDPRAPLMDLYLPI